MKKKHLHSIICLGSYAFIVFLFYDVTCENQKLKSPENAPSNGPEPRAGRSEPRELSLGAGRAPPLQIRISRTTTT